MSIANDSKIKLESNDLQTYLESFNSDIGEVETLEGQVENEEEEGTYFVDDLGNYYYQATKDAEPVLTDPPENIEVDESELVEEDVNEDQKPGEFQNMTILQSKTNPNEVSYVLIMDEMNEENEKVVGEEDEDIYEFEGENDEEDEGPLEDIEECDEIEESKGDILKFKKTKKPVPMKSSQIHMCNYCNYTSSKRYLLSRHMKSHSEERPHKCSVCERGFKTIASLQNHVNTHTGTKPHRCKFCESAFTTSGELIYGTFAIAIRTRNPTHEKSH